MSDSFRYALDAAVGHFATESEFARKKPAAGQKGFDFGDDEPPAPPVASVASGGFDEHKINREHEAHDGKRPGEFAPKETPEANPEEPEAEGPLWYGMKHRPPAPGAIPKGNYDHKPHPDFRHGQISYGRPLTEDEQRSYELSPIHEDAHLPALAKRVGAEMGEHAPEYAKPENDDILNDRLGHEDIRKMGHFDRDKLKAAIRSQFGDSQKQADSPQGETAKSSETNPVTAQFPSLADDLPKEEAKPESRPTTFRWLAKRLAENSGDTFDTSNAKHWLEKAKNFSAANPQTPQEMQDALVNFSHMKGSPVESNRLPGYQKVLDAVKGRHFVDELPVKDDAPKEEAKPAEPEVWHKGDRVRMTGKTNKDAGATWHEAEYLEGHRKGQKTMILDQGDKDARTAQNQQDWKDQQAGFAKLHKTQNPEPAPAKTAESQNPGAIYETQVRGGDGKPVTMYGVASRPNGEPGFGDSVFRTREEAQSHSVKKAELDKANSEFLAKQNAVKEKEAAKEAAEKSEREDVNGFSEGASPRDKANIIKTLSKKASFDGKVMSLKDKVRELVENGESPTSHETNKIQPMTRTQFNRADQRQQDAHEKKMREAGTKTVYRVGGYDLGKTAHDYAKHLISQKSVAAVAEQFPSLKDDIKPVEPEIDRIGKEASAIGDLQQKVKNRSMVFQYGDKERLATKHGKPVDAYDNLPYNDWMDLKADDAAGGGFSAKSDDEFNTEIKNRIRQIIGNTAYENAGIHGQKHWLNAIDDADSYTRQRGDSGGIIKQLDSLENAAHNHSDKLRTAEAQKQAAIGKKPEAPSLNPKGEGLPFDIEAAHVGMGKRGYAQYGDHKVKVAPHADSGTGSDMKYAVEHYLSDGKGGANRTTLPERHDSIEAAQNAAVNHLASKVNGEVKPQENATFGERFQKHKESGKSDLDATLHSLAEHLQAKGSKITADQLNRNWYNHHITGLNGTSTDENVKAAIEASVDTKPTHDMWWMDQKPTGGPQSHGAALQDQSIEKRRKELLEHADHVDAQADALRAAGSPEKADAMAKKSQVIRDKVAANRGWYQSAIKNEQESKKAEEDAVAETRRWKSEPTPAKAMTEKAMAKATPSGAYHSFAKLLGEHGWYTDGKMAIKPPAKMKAKLLAEYGDYDKESNSAHGMLSSVLKDAEASNGPSLKIIGSRTIPADKKDPEVHTVLLADDKDRHHILDARLVQTTLKAYPKATFHSTDGDMVAVKDGGQVVGMIMSRSEGSNREANQWAKETADHVQKLRESGRFHEFSRADHGCRANLIAAIHSCLNQDGKHKPDESVDTQIPEDPAQLNPHVTEVLQALAAQDPDVKEALGEYLASCAG